MKLTCALVILSLPFIASTINTNFHSTAQLLTSTSLLLRVAATKSFNTSINRVPFKTIAKGARSGVRESSEIIVRTKAKWQALWNRHSSVNVNPLPAPAIDFDKEIVAAVFLGEKPTGGYEVEIVSVERDDSALTILFREKSPRPGAILTQSFTQPFHIVSISVEGTPAVRFRRTP